MTIDELLGRLRRVKQTGPDRWLASSPTRDDKTPSLSIRVLPDGRILLHDFGGSTPAEIVSAMGITLSDLFPPRPDRVDHRRKRERAPYVAADVIRALGNEVLLVTFLAADIAEGKPVSEALRHRARVAAQRLLAGLDMATPRSDRRSEYREAARLAGALDAVASTDVDLTGLAA